MTRGQVARRLGKSIATVRRLEGILLNPVQDAHGTWRFDSDEVEQLAAGMKSGDVSLWAALGGLDGVPSVFRRIERPCARCGELERRVAELETALAVSHMEQAGQSARIQSLKAVDRAKSEEKFRELYLDIAEVVLKATGRH